MVVLFLCHGEAPGALSESRRIQDAIAGLADFWLLFHSNGGNAPPDIAGADLYQFTDESIATLPYTRFTKTIVPGSAHFPLLQFFRDHSGYHRYWLIEYDVRFSGDWRDLFDSFADHDADFLSCHLRDYADEPKWRWWEPMSHPRRRIPLAKRLRSFNPIYRISGPALLYLDRMHRDGWSGHFEALIPTLLFEGGFRLGDFGGSGRFVLPEHRNRFYIEGPQNEAGHLHEGTMRWRPEFPDMSPAFSGWERNKLFHPVKSTVG